MRLGLFLEGCIYCFSLDIAQKSTCPREKSLEKGRPYNLGHRKGAEGKRMAEWLVVAMKSGNADEAKGPY